MFVIDKYEHSQFKSMYDIYSVLEKISKPSYKDVALVLRKEFNFCNTLYLGLLDGTPVCFYLVADELLQRQGKAMHAIYLGLSSTNTDTKSRGHIIKLYKQCVHDIIQKYDPCDVFFWGTTVNPTVYAVAHKYSSDLQPRADGSYDNHGLELLSYVKMSGYWEGSSQNTVDANPFVLRGYAEARYTDSESERMSKLSRESPLFNDLGLSEFKGDRIIFVASSPSMFPDK